MAERSTAQVVWLFMVVPIIAGGGMLCFAMTNAVVRSREFSAGDWFWQAGWFGILGLGVMTALPAAGWQELRRRWRKQPPAPNPPQQ